MRKCDCKALNAGTICSIIISEKGIGDYMDEFDFGFDTEFMSDEEVEEMLENIVDMVADQIAEEDSQPSITCPQRMRQILYTYKLLKYLTKGTKAKVSCELHTPYRSMGSVSVIGSDLQFKNTDWFVKAIEFASNFEVYPKIDGTVQMNFTFHGLTKAFD